jgi:hypothetical protein
VLTEEGGSSSLGSRLPLGSRVIVDSQVVLRFVVAVNNLATEAAKSNSGIMAPRHEDAVSRDDHRYHQLSQERRRCQSAGSSATSNGLACIEGHFVQRSHVPAMANEICT